MQFRLTLNIKRKQSQALTKSHGELLYDISKNLSTVMWVLNNHNDYHRRFTELSDLSSKVLSGC